ncbi:MAG: 50S ribosomal protein L11 methyltransferase [Bacteroidales bacterium]|jgi:ribosomal protein L11 methyltransferase|nr:50S ribosomal protein L11 methyltransferase [Bacteroidales bacterium]
MNYIEIRFSIDPEGGEGEVLAALLADIGFEGVVEENQLLKAYIPESEFNEENLRDMMILAGINKPFGKSLIAEQNWNEVWESQFEPVVIAGRIYVRAPFHPDRNDIDFELVIEPRMSFGTAHHETTALMLEYLLELPLEGRSVLDMGCGTGILAIMAAKLGANPVVAIDNDTWAVSNARDNILINNTPSILIELGDAHALTQYSSFDVILANINRNILLNDMKEYCKVLNNQGIILFSGFYLNDLPAIEQAASQNQLRLISYKNKNNWVAATFAKSLKD